MSKLTRICHFGIICFEKNDGRLNARATRDRRQNCRPGYFLEKARGRQVSGIFYLTGTLAFHLGSLGSNFPFYTVIRVKLLPVFPDVFRGVHSEKLIELFPEILHVADAYQVSCF